jgi:hypothetical protein
VVAARSSAHVLCSFDSGSILAHRSSQSTLGRVQIRAAGSEGNLLELVGPENGYLRYPHIHTSIEVRSGASGGPVFGPDGHAFAVNCRGWDLQDQEPLSTVVPVSQVLDLQFAYPHIPVGSGEERAVPSSRRGGPVTLRDLAAWGHIALDPS